MVVVIEVSNETRNHAVDGEEASNHDGATAMLDDGQLVFGIEARAHRTSHPPHTVTFDNLGPLMACPIEMTLRAIHSVFAIFCLSKAS